ncbi:MAG TPA: hypothetical protein VGA79_00995 [Desulfobaccales bacterium]|jgi:hypothetical protein
MRRAWIFSMMLGLTMALAGTPALADGYAVVPVIPPGTPHWAPVPGVAGVQYAPNIRADLFRYQGAYYCQYGGRWYRGGAAQGPWSVVQGPPQVFRRIEAPYFKVPPGWARGKKTGWGRAHVPPGQMKKLQYGGGHIPPGQLKKMAP